MVIGPSALWSHGARLASQSRCASTCQANSLDDDGLEFNLCLVDTTRATGLDPRCLVRRSGHLAVAFAHCEQAILTRRDCPRGLTLCLATLTVSKLTRTLRRGLSSWLEQMRCLLAQRGHRMGGVALRNDFTCTAFAPTTLGGYAQFMLNVIKPHACTGMAGNLSIRHTAADANNHGGSQ